MNKKLKADAVDQLFDAILCLKTKEECYSFFEDLCTVNAKTPKKMYYIKHRFV